MPGSAFDSQTEGVAAVGHDRLAGYPSGVVSGEYEDAGCLPAWPSVDDLAAEAAADDRLRRGPSIIGVRVSEGARR